MKDKKEHISLSSFKGTNPFSVPDGYFDSFHKNLMEKIDAAGEKPESRTLSQVIRPALWLAASFIIILSIIGVAVKYVERWNNNSEKTIASAQEPDATTMYYLSDWMLYNILEKEGNEDFISDEAIEEILLASVSVYDLFE